MIHFNKIYTDHYPGLYRFAMSFVKDHHAASDILQEVFVYFWEKLQSNHRIDYPKSWLYKAVLNKCSCLSKQEHNIDEIEKISLIDETPAPFEKNELESQLRKILDNLPQKERTLAILYSEGLSYREIADVSNIKFTSIGKMLSRTLTKIENEFKKQGYEMFV